MVSGGENLDVLPSPVTTAYETSTSEQANGAMFITSYCDTCKESRSHDRHLIIMCQSHDVVL